jgi:hypothetical protein
MTKAAGEAISKRVKTEITGSHYVRKTQTGPRHVIEALGGKKTFTKIKRSWV